MILALSLVTSFLTLLVIWLAGRKDIRAWYLGLANQVLWSWFAILTKAWGLLPMCAVLTVMYAHNLRKWRRAWAEETADQVDQIGELRFTTRKPS